MRRIRLGVFGICLTLLLAAVVYQSVANAETFEYRQFQRGIAYLSSWHDTYPTVDQSLEALAGTGANWVALIVTWYQDNRTDSSIKPNADLTSIDASLVHAVQTIHRLGMRIMLKPHVDSLDGRWRAEIEPKDVNAWFESYRAFITHYAELAQAYDVETLCIGTELNSMTLRSYTTYWLGIIEDVRRIFVNELTYAASSSPNSAWQDLEFWEELDYVGIDAYFPLTGKNDPTVSELKHAWEIYVSQIETWQRLIGKQIIFTEIGYRDVAGTNSRPADWQAEGPGDQQEQANCYEAALETFWGRAWLQGIFWWAWTSHPQPRDYTPQGKLAETVLGTWYAKPFIPDGTPSDAVPALVAIQQAESAIARAQRENRIGGLDSAEGMLTEAIDAFQRNMLAESEALATNAKNTADNSSQQETTTSSTQTPTTTTTIQQQTTTTTTTQLTTSTQSSEQSTTSAQTTTAQTSGIGFGFAVFGIGVGAAAAAGGLAVVASQSRREVYTFAGYYYCRTHRVPLWLVEGQLWCPIEHRYLRA